ncbi:MAG: hypothetical protein WAX80_00640 [Minisyncoccia bacterium]
MPKSIEDIIVPDRNQPASRQGRSIRDIPIPESRRKEYKSVPSPIPQVQKEYGSSPTYSPENNSSMTPRRGVWIASGLALLILIFAVLSIFDGATLAYVPKSANVSFDNDIYTAEKTGSSGFFFSVVKLSKDKGVSVNASGEQQVNRKSSGTIIVYNNATTESQRLVATTRFETPTGLVYRVAKDIVIPGKKTVAGVSTPGSIEAVVYADVAGEKYNIDMTDFTLPGLKGSARYSTIYARSKTAMSGGFVGVEKVISEEDETQAKTGLEATLKDELLAEAKAQVPEDFILLPSLSSVTYETLPQTASEDSSSAMVNMRANLSGVMFKKADLSTNLAAKKVTLSSGELVDITNLDSLGLAFSAPVPADLLSSPEIKFSVTGQSSVVWRTDEVALKADLVGKNKRDILSILNNYPTILSATATIRPFWKSSFSDNAEDITIKKLPVE